MADPAASETPPRRRFWYMAIDRGLDGVLRLGHDGSATLDAPDGACDEIRDGRARRVGASTKRPPDPLAMGEVLGVSPGMAAMAVGEMNPGFLWVLIRPAIDPLPNWMSPGEVARLFLSLDGPWELRRNGTLIQAGLRFLPDGSVEVRP